MINSKSGAISVFGMLRMVLHFVWYINLVWKRVAFGINNIVLIYISTSRKTWSSLTSNHTHTHGSTCTNEEEKNVCVNKHMTALVLSVFYRHSWFGFSVFFFFLWLCWMFFHYKSKIWGQHIIWTTIKIWQQVAELLFFFCHENTIDPIDKCLARIYKFWQTNDDLNSTRWTQNHVAVNKMSSAF